MQETQAMWVQSLGQEDPPEEGIVTHCGILTWRIPRTEEPGWLQSTGLVTSIQTRQTEVAKQQQQQCGISDHFVISYRVYSTAFP